MLDLTDMDKAVLITTGITLVVCLGRSSVQILLLAGFMAVSAMGLLGVL